MPLPHPDAVYPRPGDSQTVYLKNVVTRPNISVGEYSFYNDSLHDPREFQDRNVLYHYPVNRDRLVIGRFCSIACGARFLMNSANHTLRSLSTYPFPIFRAEWGGDMPVQEAWDNHGDIVVGNDVWIGFEAVVLAGVRIGDGAIIGARTVVTKDVPAYAVVGGLPARVIRKRFPDAVVEDLLALQWWDWPAELIAANLSRIAAGDVASLKEVAPQVRPHPGRRP